MNEICKDEAGMAGRDTAWPGMAWPGQAGPGEAWQARFKTLYADPPWSWTAWSSKGEGRAASNHYKVMTLNEIKGLRPMIDELAADDCALCLWATAPLLPRAFEVMASWGFVFKTVAFTWIKLNKDGTPFSGLGYWSRQNSELCLLGTRGKPKRKAKNVSQVVLAPRGRHSAKPPEVRQRIERLLDGPYLELFARERVPGWDAWGDELLEVNGEALALTNRNCDALARAKEQGV